MRPRGIAAGALAGRPDGASNRAVNREIQDRLRRLAEIRSAVEVDGSGGDPLIRGTDVSAYRIAGLARGQSDEETVEDHRT